MRKKTDKLKTLVFKCLLGNKMKNLIGFLVAGSMCFAACGNDDSETTQSAERAVTCENGVVFEADEDWVCVYEDHVECPDERPQYFWSAEGNVQACAGEGNISDVLLEELRRDHGSFADMYTCDEVRNRADLLRQNVAQNCVQDSDCTSVNYSSEPLPNGQTQWCMTWLKTSLALNQNTEDSLQFGSQLIKLDQAAYRCGICETGFDVTGEAFCSEDGQCMIEGSPLDQ